MARAYIGPTARPVGTLSIKRSGDHPPGRVRVRGTPVTITLRDGGGRETAAVILESADELRRLVDDLRQELPR